ncbi:MAG: hypothetical protein OXF31_08700 [Gammaproteobacteria bacterium]|nr:hypothetical protein [Gammaproteobacteria bacterium]
MLSPRFEVRASLDLQYSDDYQPVDDNDPANIQDAFAKVNARVELVGDDRWSVALLGKNLTHETVSNAPNDIPLGNVGFLAATSTLPIRREAWNCSWGTACSGDGSSLHCCRTAQHNASVSEYD